jgi:hypothetical protein
VSTYVISHDAGGPYIQCRVCARISYNATDIAALYCGGCHAFHADLERDSITEMHRARHVTLDEALVELFDDYVKHFPRVVAQQVTVGQLMTWSGRQLVEPTDPPCENYVCAHCGGPVENGEHKCAEGEGSPTAAPLATQNLEVNGDVE